jgi:hypothetical protein
MKINIKNTPERVELIKAMVDPDPSKAMAAREAFAGFIAPVVQQVLNLGGLSPLIYTDWPYNEDDEPEIPLDMFYGVGVDNVTVWQQSMAGGLGSSLVTGLQTLKVSTYNLDSAVSLLVRDVKRSRLPTISLALNRMSQEILAKQERNAFLVVLKALAEATTNGNKHVIASNAANVLAIQDLNALLTRAKRINTAFNNGTPETPFSRGATDAILSPEMMEQIRAFAYQPMNTRAGSITTSGATSIALPDSIREKVFNNAGSPEMYGIMLHEALEFGVSQNYNILFGTVASGQSIPAGGGGTFAAATDELVLCWDATREVSLRPVQTFSDSGATVSVQVDDQFTKRSGKIGWFADLVEGRIQVDARQLTGIAV